MSFSIEGTISEVGDCSRNLRNSTLVGLSNLSQSDIGVIKQTWHTIELKRRRQILNRLVDLAEDNFELDFGELFKICLRDEDEYVRYKAIEGLWENEESALINPLIDMLNKDSSEKVQAAAATALGKFAMLAELKKLRSIYAVKVEEALVAAIYNENKSIEVERRVIEAVAPLNEPRVKAAINQAYQSKNTKLKASAIYAMGRNCDPYWLPVLLRELESTNAELRYEAAVACGELGEIAAVPSLIKLVNDHDINTSLAAIEALGKIGGVKAKEGLKRCLNSSDEVIQQAAEDALYRLEVEENPLSYKIEPSEHWHRN